MKHCEMDIKVEIKEEDDVTSQNETELFDEVVTMNSDVAIKTPFIKHLKQIKCETVTSSYNWEIDRAETEQRTLTSDFGSQNNEGEDRVRKDNKPDSIDEMHQVFIKEEPWWLETETCHDIKDGDFSPVISSRSCTNAACGDNSSKSSLLEVSSADASLCKGNDRPEHECQKNVTEMPTVEECFLSGKHSDEAIHTPLHLKQKGLIDKGERPFKCQFCVQSFSWLSHLKIHLLIHEAKKAHRCETCDKSFTRLSCLKRHNLIHEGKKPHQCKICYKSFTLLSNLKTHSVIHEGKKPHQCKTCGKNFTHLSNLIIHNVIHEGKKPHQCKVCDKSFTHLSSLIKHKLIHERK